MEFVDDSLIGYGLYRLTGDIWKVPKMVRCMTFDWRGSERISVPPPSSKLKLQGIDMCFASNNIIGFQILVYSANEKFPKKSRGNSKRI